MSCDLTTCCSVEIPNRFCDQLGATLTVSLTELPSHLPTNIISCDQSYEIKVCMELTAVFKKIFCGYWCVNLAAESCGPGKEWSAGSQVIKMDNCDPQTDDCVTFIVKGSDLIECPSTGCGEVFYFCVTMVALDPCDKKPIGIAGFCKLGPVMVY